MANPSKTLELLILDREYRINCPDGATSCSDNNKLTLLKLVIGTVHAVISSLVLVFWRQQRLAE